MQITPKVPIVTYTARANPLTDERYQEIVVDHVTVTYAWSYQFDAWTVTGATLHGRCIGKAGRPLARRRNYALELTDIVAVSDWVHALVVTLRPKWSPGA